jgi:hypothetical protein
MGALRLAALSLARGPILAGLAALSGCLGAPSSEDWLAVGFRTPEQTFRTFQSALRADLPDLEWRTLSADLKQEIGGQLGYRLFRTELFRRQPWLKFAARAEIVETHELAPDRVRLMACVDTWFHDESFAVDFVREDYYELWIDGRCVQDDAVPWSQIAREEGDLLTVRVPLSGALEPGSSRELRAGHEWKIADFPQSLAATP